MKLTILGTGAALPRPGGACSGYLVEEGETRLLLDCGNGALSNLMQVADYRAITAIVLSHWHADHWFDLVPYRYGLKYGLRPLPSRPWLYLPPGGTAILEGVATYFDPAGRFFGDVFALAEYDPAQGLAVGPLRIAFARTQHVVPTWAMRLTNGTRSLVYSADTGPSAAVEALARDADLFLCEASMQGPGDQSPGALHLSAIQAGEMAARAGARRLLLTHLWPELDPQRTLAQAQQFYPRAELAEELRSYEVG